MTLAELEEYFGVSRDKIIYRYKQLPKSYSKRRGNKIVVLKAGIDELSKFFGGNKTMEKPSKNEGKTEQLQGDLNEELKEKNKQISELQKIIQENQKLLDQQQQLHLQANQRIEMLEKQLSLGEPKTAPQDDVVAKEEFEKLEENRQELIKSIDFQSKEIKALHEAKKEDEKINEELFNELQRLHNKKWYQFWK